MTTNYKKGRAKEYRIKRKYEKDGWIVLRTAGSHGFADLVCIDKENKKIHFIQVKPKKFSKKKKLDLELENFWLDGLFVCQFKVV